MCGLYKGLCICERGARRGFSGLALWVVGFVDFRVSGVYIGTQP